MSHNYINPYNLEFDVPLEVESFHGEDDCLYCPLCGEVWTSQSEIAEALDHNDDWIVLVIGSDHCPDCYPVDLY